MDQTNRWWSSTLVGALIALSSILVIVGISLDRVASSHISFGLSFNAYSLFSFASALIDACLICLVLVKKRYTVATNWFLLFLGGALILALTEGFQRSSIAPGAALYWQNFSYIGDSLLPPVFYLFIVAYTSQRKRQYVLLSSILVLTCIVIVFLAGTGLFFGQTGKLIQHAPWGYYSNLSKPANILASWYFIFYILGTGMLLQFRKVTQNQLIKKQVVLFILAFLLPFIAAVITDLLLPAIKPNVIPPLATFVGAFSGIITYYGIRRYRLFDLDPQALAQNILDTMSEAVIITRPDMSIESINPEAERLLGVTTKKVAKQKLENFFTDSDWSNILDKIADKTGRKAERRINKSKVKHSDGKFTPVQIAVTSLYDSDEKLANILVLSDISALTKSFDALRNSAGQIYRQNEELKKLQAQLIEEKAGVEHIVDVRTKELVDAQEKLKAADQLKTEFIILTSHNLRTPLTIAKGYAEMITDDKINVDKKTIIEGLRGGLDRLGVLVEDLLAITSIESGDQPALEKVTFKDVVEPLIKELHALALTRNDKVVTNLPSGDIKLKANTSRLQGALRNVLNNACKFTENGTVELNANRSGDKLIINISDTGIGISASELPKLFTKFHRATNVMTGSYDGEGIGLYLSKLIIEEHKGKISCVSRLDKGSTFTIELPCY